MDSSRKLHELAVEVNDLLSQYIKIHNRRMKEAGTFLSLFIRIDYKELYDEAITIYFKTSAKHNDIGELKVSGFFDDLLQDQRDFFIKLVEYIDALAQTTFLLSELVGLEYQRSQNMISLPLSEFMNKQRTYEETMKGCKKIGAQLQHLYEKLNSTCNDQQLK